MLLTEYIIFLSLLGDTVQRKSSKACHPTLKSYRGKNRNSECRTLTNNHNDHYRGKCLIGKQRKSENKCRHHNFVKNNPNITTTDEQPTGSSRIYVDEWLEKDLQSYKSLKSSGIEGTYIYTH